MPSGGVQARSEGVLLMGTEREHSAGPVAGIGGGASRWVEPRRPTFIGPDHAGLGGLDRPAQRHVPHLVSAGNNGAGYQDGVPCRGPVVYADVKTPPKAPLAVPQAETVGGACRVPRDFS